MLMLVGQPDDLRAARGLIEGRPVPARAPAAQFSWPRGRRSGARPTRAKPSCLRRNSRRSRGPRPRTRPLTHEAPDLQRESPPAGRGRAHGMVALRRAARGKATPHMTTIGRAMAVDPESARRPNPA